jgi:hypothetical protein
MYKRHRFPPEIIQYTVWLYHRFNLSHRDVEDLLAERGITVSYEAIRLWCNNINGDRVKAVVLGMIAAFDPHWANGPSKSIVRYAKS